METAPTPPPAAPPSVRGQLLGPGRPRFLGKDSDGWLKLLFESNATISVIVLLLIVFTLFKEASGFIPGNRRNLEVYRLAGLEYVDIVKRETQEFAALSRQLGAARLAWLQQLQRDGLTLAAANERLEPLDAVADRLSDAVAPLNDLVTALTEQASSVKDRARVSLDLKEARQNLIDGAAKAGGSRAAELRAGAAAMTVETIDFAAEVKSLTARFPEIQAAHRQLATDAAAAVAARPQCSDPKIARQLEDFATGVGKFLASLPEREKALADWRPDKPVSLFETMNAFAFGRDWVTASFWQDWYGVLPLLFGSFTISMLALAIAIPFGICAAIYVNQVARPWEQRLIKPYIEFVSAIPSVVLGFFGIAVLGETLRAVSQSEWLAWVPGFPMRERLTAFTAGALLALMAVPTIFTLAEDALQNVPRAFKEASLALGATRLQTILQIILPAALSGIVAAMLLGFGRVVGETMVVLLCAGNRIEIPNLSAGVGVAFQPMHTMTGIIAQEMGEVVRGSLHYRALFMVGCLLFLLSLAVNYAAQRIVRRYRISIG